MKEATANSEVTSIAVTGMAGRFPGARSVIEFWKNLRDGAESISLLTDEQLRAAGAAPADLRNPDYVRAAAVLEDIDRFDAAFFGFSAKDAAIMDPQHRHFLECAWEALENAGWCSGEFRGRVGVYAGSGMNSYLIHNLLTNPELLASAGIFLLKQTGNDKDVLATRVSYQLNLTGPSLAVQTACSTSLVAIHLACQSLLNLECDMALAGGVTIEIPHGLGYVYREGEILSRDGHCRAFDANSSGTVFGSGVGVVVLRRLDDALRDGDFVHAVIRGTAINNDGARKVGYLAPSVAGQAEAISEALAVAGVEACSISYVEAHGTGTAVGDPIEVTALTRAFRESTDRNGFCALGSVKTNVGHLDAAAGVAGFIKTVLALEHRQLPPSLNFSKPNPLIDFDSSPFFVNTTLREWESNGGPRRAGVTSLGIGGTNAHAILEEAPKASPSGDSRSWQLLTLSAKTSAALDAMTRNFAEYLPDLPASSPANLADVAFTCHLGRKAFPLRRAVLCRDLADAADALRRKDPKRLIFNSARESDRSVVFLFSGQGSQYAGMGRELYQSEPEFRSAIDFCSEFLAPHLGLDLRTIFFPQTENAEDAERLLNQTRLTQPALFVIEYALAKLWLSWGIQPEAMIGHSVGEFAAACIAGVFSLETAMQIVAERGRLMQSLPSGAMTAVLMPEQEVLPLLGGSLSLASVNAAEQCVVSGPEDLIRDLENSLATRNVTFRRLRVSHAFHSSMMNPILETFTEFLGKFEYGPPRIPYISSATGSWVTETEAKDPRYWARQLRETVRFSDGVAELLKDPNAMFLEVGPGNTLSALVAGHRNLSAGQEVISSMRSRRDASSDVEVLLHALGQLWAAGKKPDWRRFHEHEKRRRVPLPTYPFERKRFWIAPGRQVRSVESSQNNSKDEPVETSRFFGPIWKRSDLVPDHDSAENAGPWLIFQDSQGLGAQLIELLRRRGEQCIAVLAGESFARFSDDQFQIDPGNSRDYIALIDELNARRKLPRTIVHLWSVVAAHPQQELLDDLPSIETKSFYSLLFLSQALGAADIDGDLRIGIVSNSLYQVANESIFCPQRALLSGPCDVIPKEFSNIHCCSIDVAMPPNTLPHGAQMPEGIDEIAKLIVSELRGGLSDSPVAYRNNRRWVRSFEPLHLAASKRPLSLRERGVYLVTGGLGGIGLVLAGSLARSVGARLVLVSRSAIPPRQAWNDWLASHDDRDPLALKIRKIQSIENAGGEVLLATADVSDLEAMRRVAAQARARFGQINGVVHAAGVLDDSLILQKDPASASRVLAPKVRGTLVLDSVFANEPLDFFIVLSSVSSILAPAGQVDYAAASAFLDAFAQARASRSKCNTLAIQWPRWRDVGMAMDFDGTSSRHSRHPLLQKSISDGESEAAYSTVLSLSRDWIVNEHRLKGSAGLFPGTGYIEMVRAAIAARCAEAALTIRNLQLSAPLKIEAGTEQPVRLFLRKDAEAYRFSVATRADDGRDDWIECALGEASVDALSSPPPRWNIDEIRRRCSIRELVFDYSRQNATQDKYFDFGPRWRNLKRINLGGGEALSLLELSDEFASDLSDYQVHPALLDMATGSAMFLIPGYESTDYLYVPMSYGSIALRGPLPARCYSHIRAKSGSTIDSPIATFDITILDDNGNTIIEIEDFSIRQIRNRAILDVKPAGVGQRTSAARFNRDWITEAGTSTVDSISSVEGSEAFERVLGDLRSGNIVVFPSDFAAFLEKSGPPTAETAVANGSVLPAGKNTSNDEVESTLARWWKELLGVEDVTVQDNFFDLGGQSLTGVRLLAKVKKTYGVDLKLATLFEAPTIERLARLVRKEEAPASFSTVVPIQTNGWKPPLFLIHGLGGRVLGFRDLVKHLESDQPVYGVEYPAAASKPVSLELEKLAAGYIEEIRAMQPQGPYYLLGYSFGGLMAFEIAQQLRAAQQPVGLLGMLDTWQMEHAKRRTFREWVKRRAELVRLHLHRVVFGPDRGSFLQEKLTRRLDDVKALVWRLLYSVFTATGTRIPRSLERVNDINWFAALHYTARLYPGRITLFRAEKGIASIDERYGHELGWGPFAADGVEVLEIPGTHHDMMREPNVRILAREVTARLARCREEQSQTVRAINGSKPSIRDSVPPKVYAPDAIGTLKYSGTSPGRGS